MAFAAILKKYDMGKIDGCECASKYTMRWDKKITTLRGETPFIIQAYVTLHYMSTKWINFF